MLVNVFARQNLATVQYLGLLPEFMASAPDTTAECL